MLQTQDSDEADLIDEAFGRIAFTTKVVLEDHFEVNIETYISCFVALCCVASVRFPLFW